KFSSRALLQAADRVRLSMNHASGKGRNALAFLVTVLLGAAMSLGLYGVWDLEWRWIAVVCVGIAGVAVSMCFARKFSDFLIVVTLFSLPFATFTKWIFASDTGELYQGALIGTFGIGLI